MFNSYRFIHTFLWIFCNSHFSRPISLLLVIVSFSGVDKWQNFQLNFALNHHCRVSFLYIRNIFSSLFRRSCTDQMSVFFYSPPLLHQFQLNAVGLTHLEKLVSLLNNLLSWFYKEQGGARLCSSDLQFSADNISSSEVKLITCWKWGRKTNVRPQQCARACGSLTNKPNGVWTGSAASDA